MSLLFLALLLLAVTTDGSCCCPSSSSAISSSSSASSSSSSSSSSSASVAECAFGSRLCISFTPTDGGPAVADACISGGPEAWTGTFAVSNCATCSITLVNTTGAADGYVLAINCCGVTATYAADAGSTCDNLCFSNVLLADSRYRLCVLNTDACCGSSSSSSSAAATSCDFGPLTCLQFTAESTNVKGKDFLLCVRKQNNGTYFGTYTDPSPNTSTTVSVTLVPGATPSDWRLTVDPGVLGKPTTYSPIPTGVCVPICFDNVTAGNATWEVCTTDRTDCCELPGSSSSASASASASGSVPVPFNCCPNLDLSNQLQLGAFLVCSSSSSISGSGAGFQPYVPTAKPCDSCKTATPPTWSYTPTPGTQFSGSFVNFNGMWTLQQESGAVNACKWASDPANRDTAEFVLFTTQKCRLTLTDAFGNIAVYEGEYDGDCCTEVPLTLVRTTASDPNYVVSGLTIVPACPTSPTSTAATSSSSAGCVCVPKNICLNLVNGIWIGGDEEVTLRLVCVGSNVNGWTLLVTINGVTTTYYAQPGSSCTPDLTLLFFNVVGICGEWHITISTDTSPCGSSSSSSSSASSSSAGVVLIPNPCCTSGIPSTLYVSMDNGGGTFPVFFDQSQPGYIWASNPQPGPTCFGAGSQVHFTFACQPSTGQFTFSGAGLNGTIDLSGTAISCSPFLWSQTGLGGGACSTTSIKVTVSQ